jgi:hypothetical protein
MNRRWYQLAVTGLVALMLCGCLPRRLFWSPDGQHAAIILPSDELRLCDADGKLSGVIASEC